MQDFMPMCRFRNSFFFCIAALGLAVAGAVLFGRVAAAAEQSLDMEESVRRALVANNRVRAARYQLFGAEAGEKAARGAMGPSVNLSYEYTHYDERPETSGIAFGVQDQFDMVLNVNQPLFTGLRLLSQYQRAGLNRELLESRLAQTELQIILEVQTAFLDLLKARKNVQSAEDALVRLESVLTVAEAFYEVGVRPRLDVLEAEVDVARAERDLVNARNNVSTQTVRLNTLLDYGLDPGIRFVGDLEYRPVDIDIEQSVIKALRNRPDMRVAEKSVAIGEKNVTVAASGFYPDIDLNFDYIRTGDDPGVQGTQFSDASEWRIRGQLRWAIFEFGQTYYSYRESQENLSQLEAEYRDLKREVLFQVQSAFLNVQDAEKRIMAARKGVEAAREAFRMAQERYQAQVGTYTEVLDAQASFSEAEATLTAALADYHSALARFNFAVGERRLSLY